MNNIVNNAVKYTNTGGLIMGVRRRGGGSALFVMDSGIGIPAESLSTIYDEFTMLVDSSRKAGSGLGLSIVKKMLRLLGMDIQTLSKVGVGSTFYIDLPKTYSIPSARKPRIETTASKEVPEPQKADTAIEEAPIAQDSTGRLVAVVDDVVVLRKTICRVLESFGMRTIDVGNLSELEAVIKDVKPDLLITDYKLEHGVTGYDIIVAARKLIADLPAFIITGDTSPALVSEMSARGVTIYYKPVTINTMIDAVNEHLAS